MRFGFSTGGNWQRILIRGTQSRLFLVICGIRQGCPLSPLLFAVVIDVFLRRLYRRHLTITLRAFADDIGLVVQHISHLTAVQFDFLAFAKISGLHLNLPKTTLVPLWESTVEAVTHFLRDDYPCLARMTVSYAAKYLGIWMGPLGAAQSWMEPLAKYQKAVRRWSQGSWGLHLATLVYNVYVSSILGFVAQFHAPSKEILDAENNALRCFVRGPGNWCTTAELFHLDTWLGFRYRFQSIQAVSLAARARLSHCERKAVEGCKRKLGDEFLDSNHRRPTWYPWFYNSPFHNLEQANTDLSSMNITIPQISAQILANVAGTAHRDPTTFVNKQLQRHIYKAIMVSDSCRKEDIVRARTRRWQTLINHRRMNGFLKPASASRQFLSNLEVIHRKSRPRVAAAVWRTLWNGWCTARRFQGTSQCRFGCGHPNAADSLEHYFFCDILVKFGVGYLGLRREQFENPGYFLMLENYDSEEELVTTAHLVYAAYATHNTLRHSSPFSSPSSTLACLRRFVQQAVFHVEPALKSLVGVKRARPTAVLPEDIRIPDILDVEAPPRGRPRFS
jgi:hypothetical protein